MKKKILTVTLSLLLLCGAAACKAAPSPKTAPEQQTTSDNCPDGTCPKQNNDCPDGTCPEQNGDCPDGNCPEQNDSCPDGTCPDEKEKRPPARGVRPRRRTGRLAPPEFPIRPVPPVPEPTL